MLDRATEIAFDKHGKQTWVGNLPYTEHLRRVDNQVVYFCQKENLSWPDELHLRCAAWLHDSVEDTDLSVDDIRKELGEEVSKLVWAVTDEPGRNRSERHRLTYPKIKATRHATLLKLADRTVNTTVSNSNSSFFKMYQKEFPSFKDALYVIGEYQHCWNCVEEVTYHLSDMNKKWSVALDHEPTGFHPH